MKGTYIMKFNLTTDDIPTDPKELEWSRDIRLFADVNLMEDVSHNHPKFDVNYMHLDHCIDTMMGTVGIYEYFHIDPVTQKQTSLYIGKTYDGFHQRWRAFVHDVLTAFKSVYENAPLQIVNEPHARTFCQKYYWEDTQNIYGRFALLGQNVQPQCKEEVNTALLKLETATHKLRSKEYNVNKLPLHETADRRQPYNYRRDGRVSLSNPEVIMANTIKDIGNLFNNHECFEEKIEIFNAIAHQLFGFHGQRYIMPESKLPIDNSESMTYTVPYESAIGIVENKEGEIVDKFSYYMGLNRNNTEHKKIIDAMPTYPEFDKYGNVTGQKSKLSRKDYMSTNGKSRTEAKDLDLYTQMGTL